MKAIVLTRYGSPDNLEVQEVSQPIPRAHEVLVKVAATTATTADTMMRKATPFISRFFLGFFRPRKAITGTGFAGEVVEVGKNVSRFQPGDQVFGETGTDFGANAEYVSVSEEGVMAKLPSNLSFEEAATLTDGPLTSINFLKNLGKIKSGQKVLINGASGSLGTAAVQLAKYYGAEVTGVSSTKNAELVQSLGADHVIDYHSTDFTNTGEQYDIIFDTIGKSSFSKSKRALKADGIYLSPVLDMGLLFQMLRTSKSRKRAVFSATGLLPHEELRQLLDEVIGIIEGGYLRPVIDRKYPLEKAVEAHKYVDTGRKRGNVVLLAATGS
jgi:NADPH:quinone reductase-like Zn-dependent oxidoreductase